MRNFGDLLAGLDRATEDHLCDDALYLVDGAPPVPVRVQLEHPVRVDALQTMSFTRSRPTMRVARAAAPAVREDDRFQIVLAGDVPGDVWQVAEAPTAEGDGRWWVFEVMPG